MDEPPRDDPPPREDDPRVDEPPRDDPPPPDIPPGRTPPPQQEEVRQVGDLPEPQQDEDAKRTAGFVAVAWRQGNQWILVDPPYDIANFSFPTSTPTGSKFVRNASEALEFVLATGELISAETRQRFADFFESIELESFEQIKEITERDALADAEARITQATFDQEAAVSEAEMARIDIAKAIDNQRIDAEKEGPQRERDRLRAEIEAELEAFGIGPQNQGPQLPKQPRKRINFSFGRASQKPVIASAKEVDFTA